MSSRRRVLARKDLRLRDRRSCATLARGRVVSYSAHTTMSLIAGTRLGPYEIVAPLGAGGMGEVYRARDARLGRDVAVKVLPAVVRQPTPSGCAASSRRRGPPRALNHPNILAVYDIGTHEGAPYVVSELLEGETLRERLGSARAPARKAVEYASQIAHGPRRRARQGHRPPRPQAGEPLRHARRPREDPRLRPRQADAGRPSPSRPRRRSPTHGAADRAPARCSARSATCRPSRCAARPPTTAPTSSPSASCSTRCSPAGARSRATRRSRR